jgi:alkanesulfonate monooxygenase SsuD/methylene tetrahydromethanopterin reductase-like flavin-dependent oxidoreductase (luciferase family)
MRFSFFDQLSCDDSQSESQRLDDLLSQIELGDKLGFDTVWLAELHFNRATSLLSCPLMILSAAAQRTTRIRLGTAVTLLPLHHPLRIMEEVGTADILSHGRIELGIGRGPIPIHHAGFSVDPAESRERTEEALAILCKAWTNERFSYDGKFFKVKDAAAVPRPLQKPHPPIRMAATSQETFALAGRLGLSIFSSQLFIPVEKLTEYLATYRDALKPGTRRDIALVFPVHVAGSRQEARQEIELSLRNYFQIGARLQQLGLPKIDAAMKQALARLEQTSYESVDASAGIFGEPRHCIERISAIQKQFQPDEFICYFNQGGLLDPAALRRSMELFAQEVMPQFRDS